MIDLIVERKRRKLLRKNQDYRQIKETSLLNILPEIFLLVILFLVLTSVSVFLTTFRYYQIKQSSMKPLFNNYQNEEISDGVFVRLNSSFEVGDIVVLKDSDATLIKRVIAAGGDKVSIVKKEFQNPYRTQYFVQIIAKDTTVPYVLYENYINDEDPLGMKKVYDTFTGYLSNTTSQTETILEGADFVTYLVLEEDEVFYLGDNRGSSLDSSSSGPVKASQVIGKVEIVVWKEKNYLFHIFAYIFGFKNI